MAERSRIAVQGQRMQFFLFNKITAGRQCSCFKIESNPDSQCVACFNTGIVGGYSKYGTILNVVDVTHPNVTTVNVRPDYKQLGGMKPIKWTLLPGATSGYIETKVHLKTNLGRLDSFNSVHEEVAGGFLRHWIKAPSDSEYVLITNDKDVEARLGNPWVSFKVELKRAVAASDSPKLALLYLRYQVRKKLLVDCDIPKTERQTILSELGLDDDWQRQSFWLPNFVRKINPGDFLASQSGSDLWKIYGARETAPTDYLIDWDLQTRLVRQRSEVKAMVPIGRLGVDDEKERKKEVRDHDPNY
jgi:hypothetical protein